MKKGLSLNCLKIPEYKDYIHPTPGNFDRSEEKIIMETLVVKDHEYFVPASRPCRFFQPNTKNELKETPEEREKRIKLYTVRASRLQDLYSGDPLLDDDRPKPKKAKKLKRLKLKEAS